MSKRLLILILLPIFLSTPALAERLFKVVDEDGNVTYQTAPPGYDEGTVDQREISGGEEPSDEAIAMDRATTNNPVTLFAIKNCKPCDNARTQLQESNIPFEEKDPTSDPQLYKTFTELVNGTSVPALTVGETVVSVYTKDNLDQALQAAGYPKAESAKEEGTKEEES